MAELVLLLAVGILFFSAGSLMLCAGLAGVGYKFQEYLGGVGAVCRLSD